APRPANVVDTIMRRAMPTPPPWGWGNAAGLPVEFPPQRRERIVVRVYDALLERNDRVVRDGDRLGADLGATLGDVAVADPSLLAKVGAAVLLVERVHLVHR